MDREPLRIRFFGGLSMESSAFQLEPTTNSSSQMTLLIARLLLSLGSEIPKSALIETLWPSENGNRDMTGALRTLVYRTRKELNRFFPQENREYIKFSRDAYYWDTTQPAVVDIHEFEALNTRYKAEKDLDQKYALAKTLTELYTGEYLPSYTYMEFVLYRNVYFRNQYVLASIFMCDYLYRAKQFEEVITLCDSTLLLYQEEERLYEYKINAYLELGQADQAMDYYRTVTTALVNKYGLEISSSFNELYKKILMHLPLKKLDIEKLESSLSEASTQQRSYYCDFYIFKNYYQISKRSVRRSFSKRYLALFTLSDAKSPNTVSSEMKLAMTTLFEVISGNLRQNDVFTRTSEWQYSVILTVPNENGANIAASRLEKHFAKANRWPYIQLNVDLKLIE